MSSRDEQTAIPLVDIRAEIGSVRGELDQAIASVLDEAQFANGPAVARFEDEFARCCAAKFCVALNTGTSALHLAMRCLNVGPGDEVITVSMSFIATAWPILYAGATPVFVDIDPRRYTMAPDRLEAAITPRTKAIVPVHLYGQCADMRAILDIANRHGIPVIEDCAQAAGAEYAGRRAGSMGRFGCFSFYPTKNLGACGEGGALTTDDPELAARARRLRDHAQVERYHHNETGYNYRMDSIQAAILSVKLRHLEDWTQRRIAIAGQYDRQLAGSEVVRPFDAGDGRHVYHLYVIRAEARDELRRYLQDLGIGTAVHYPLPIHRQEAFRECTVVGGSLPVTDEVARTCVSLPEYPELPSESVERVCQAIRRQNGET